MQWLSQFFSRRRRYNDLSLSIREHLEEKIEDLMEDGMSREEATRAARREFGNVTLIEERGREVWQWPTLESIWADVRYALRQLSKAPGFTVTAVVTLALGIAVNATMFSLVSAFLLPRLPGRDTQRVVVISSVNPNRGFMPDASPVSVPNYLAWRKDNYAFADMAAADEYRSVSLAGQGQPEALSSAAVSPHYFSVLGASPQLGRSFSDGEDQPGRDHVVILSHGLWERRFGSDRSILGRTLRLNREDYVVVGVMASDFHLLGFTPQAWTPLVLSAADQATTARNERSLYVFARLAPGVTLSQARAEVTHLARRAEKDFPETEKHWGAAVRTLPDFLIHNFGIRPALAMIMTTVSFVLLIACANVAGLLLTRAAGRQKELGIRISLGASRVRIVRQLLTECVVIALLGGSIGLLLSYFGINILRANLSFIQDLSDVSLRLDSNVLLFALSISLVSAILSGLAPALKASQTNVNTDLKSESRSASAGRSHSRIRTALVSGEIALALFLLIGTGLLIRGIFLIEHQKLGFRADHLLTASLALDDARYKNASQQILFVRNLTSPLQRIPGVEDVAFTSGLPATGGDRVPIRIKGQPATPGNQQRTASDVVITADYFRAVGIPLLRGRTFTEMDNATASRVVVVNQELAHRYFQDQEPLGKEIQLDIKGATPEWREIVGVVGNVKAYSEDTRDDPQVYEPFLQRPVAAFSLIVRANFEPTSLTPSLRHAVTQLDPALPLASVMSMDGVIERQRTGDRFFSRVLGVFALLALVLAAIGIYGLIAYSVGQRTQEIGIRMALGAKGPDILRMILKEGIKLTAIGSAIGFAMALPLPKIFEAALNGLRVREPGLYLLVLAAMLMVAMLATYVPARRATHVDPTAALRGE